MAGKPKKVTVVGMVLAVDWDDPGYDPYARPYVDEAQTVFDHYEGQGFDVQKVSLHIDGEYRVEVLS